MLKNKTTKLEHLLLTKYFFLIRILKLSQETDSDRKSSINKYFCIHK